MPGFPSVIHHRDLTVATTVRRVRSDAASIVSVVSVVETHVYERRGRYLSERRTKADEQR